jgi:alpha-mannosidase
LAYHRRHGERFLDSLLMVRGETSREFHIGIGVDLPQPIIAAETFLESPLRLDSVPGPPRSGALNWFFAAEPPQAQVQLLSSLYDQAGNLCGVRVLVRELTGKLVPCRIRCLRDISRAYRSDADGKSVGKLTVEKDSVLVTLSGNEQCRVDIIWAQPQETERA